MKLVSVVIPTYNRKEMLCECIDSVLKSSYKNLEIVVVDNCSSDGTVEAIQKEYTSKPVKVVVLQENLMAAGGRNEGIKVAAGEYILFLDNDNIVYPDMIELLVNEMDKDESIGLVGPLTINVNQGNSIWLASGGYNFFTSRPTALFAGKTVDAQKLERRYVTCYSPNAMMVSRGAVEAVGGFDKSYYAMYEEADFGYRILMAGYKEYIVTDARTSHMYHVGEDEQAKLRVNGIGFPARAYHFAKNRSVFMKKYAKWYHMPLYYLFFVHLFNVYYCAMALSCGRKDIMWAYFKGTFKGIFIRTKRIIKIDISE